MNYISVYFRGWSLSYSKLCAQRSRLAGQMKELCQTYVSAGSSRTRTANRFCYCANLMVDDWREGSMSAVRRDAIFHLSKLFSVKSYESACISSEKCIAVNPLRAMEEKCSNVFATFILCTFFLTTVWILRHKHSHFCYYVPLFLFLLWTMAAEMFCTTV